MRICVVIPTYNEAENIAGLAQAIFAACPLPGLEICVADDSSPDATADRAEALGDPRVHVLRRATDRGYGRACNEGIRYALSHGAEYVCTMDADFSHRPETLSAMLAAAERADLVIGSRYLAAQASVEDWSPLRLLFSRMAGAYIRGLVGVRVTDPTSGFRCWRSDFLRRLPLDTLESKGYSYIYETLFFAGRLGARIQEVSNVYAGRTRGESKMNSGIVWEALWLPWRIRLRWMLGKRGS